MEKLNLFNAYTGKVLVDANTDDQDNFAEGMDASLEDVAWGLVAVVNTPTLKGKTIGEFMELYLNDDGTIRNQVKKELEELDLDELFEE